MALNQWSSSNIQKGWWPPGFLRLQPASSEGCSCGSGRHLHIHVPHLAHWNYCLRQRSKDEMPFHKGARTHARVLWKWEESLSRRRKRCCAPLLADPGCLWRKANLCICLLYVFAKGSGSHRETTMSYYARSRSFGRAVQHVETKLNYRVTTIVNESLCPGNIWRAAMASRPA